VGDGGLARPPRALGGGADAGSHSATVVFSGHFAVALGARRFAKAAPTGLLISAAFAADVWEGVVAIFQVSDPTRVHSHSLLATVVFGIVLSLYCRLKYASWRDTGVIIAVAVSHSATDFLTATKAYLHPLPPFGLDLYRFPVATGTLEAVFAVAGWMLWRSSLAAESRRSAAVWGMLWLLIAAQGALFAYIAVFGPAVDSGALSKFVR
jgi:membrane-bound metal-dependent hydrolase YbcI (DUF457 family)